MSAPKREQLEKQQAELEQQISELQEELAWKQELLKNVRRLLDAKPNLANAAITFRSKPKPPWQ